MAPRVPPWSPAQAEDWEFRRFWTNIKWACATSTPALSDATVFLFEMAPHGLFRRDESGRLLRPFVERSMMSFRARSADPALFPNGLFFVLQTAAFDPSDPTHARANQGMKLFAVSPSVENGRLVADHFTFHVNAGLAESQRLQLHWTG